MISRPTYLLALLTVLCASTFAARSQAQVKFLVETNRDLGITYDVHESLNQVPNQIGTETVHLVQRFRPADGDDYLRVGGRRASWYLDVYRFNKTGRGGGDGKHEGPTTGGDKGGDDGKKTPEEILKEEMEKKLKELREKNEANSFEDWVKELDSSASSRKFKTSGKAKKGRKDRPDARFWEYSDKQGRIVWWSFAAVYDLGDVEVALVVKLPGTLRGSKVDSKYKKIAYRIIGSLRRVELEDDDEEDKERDQFATTPGRKKMLEKLKDNLKDIRNRWDYQTLPNYIVTWSWEDPTDRRAYRSAKNFAVKLANELEAMRSRFAEFYPPHEEMQDNYSIIRVCSNYDEFTRYGNTPRGVVGWFNPGTKELVVFNDVEGIFTDGDAFDFTLGVMYHEQWHQYSDQWWPNIELHRWFDEGLAEFFGSQRNRGSTKSPKWRFKYLRGRYDAIVDAVPIVPTEKIIYWSKARFYGGAVNDHYAQAWVMIDFLMRGEGRSRYWDDSFDQIMKVYGEVCLEQKGLGLGRMSEEAVDKAFEGIDIDAYEEAWVDWINSGQIKR